jgi:hypothetical protein
MSRSQPTAPCRWCFADAVLPDRVDGLRKIGVAPCGRRSGARSEPGHRAQGSEPASRQSKRIGGIHRTSGAIAIRSAAMAPGRVQTIQVKVTRPSSARARP